MYDTFWFQNGGVFIDLENTNMLMTSLRFGKVWKSNFDIEKDNELPKGNICILLWLDKYVLVNANEIKSLLEKKNWVWKIVKD